AAQRSKRRGAMDRLLRCAACAARTSLPTASFCLALNHTDRSHPRPHLRQPRQVDRLDYVIDVLVGPRLLLRKALVALGAGDDAFRLQFLVNAAAGGFLD